MIRTEVRSDAEGKLGKSVSVVMSAKSEGHMARHMGSRNLSLGNRWGDDWAYRRVAKPGRLIRNKWFGSETGRVGMFRINNGLPIRWLI
ncbi:hypothetical protein ASPFODRAFT_39012, partial [Aspergillus luchuensis CBS 106.47]